MVKGTNKRVVVVKSPIPNVFEEAIFIVKEDFMGNSGQIDVLKEAQQAANAYLRSAVSTHRKKLRFPPFLWALIGALISSASLILVYLL